MFTRAVPHSSPVSNATNKSLTATGRVSTLAPLLQEYKSDNVSTAVPPFHWRLWSCHNKYLYRTPGPWDIGYAYFSVDAMENRYGLCAPQIFMLALLQYLLRFFSVSASIAAGSFVIKDHSFHCYDSACLEMQILYIC